VEPAESSTVTLLFTDLEGSTRLWERYPSAMAAALKRHDALLQSAIEAAGGRVVKTTGDGMMAVFGSAPDAVGASLAAQRGLAKEPWGETGPLRVRMGLHAGQVEERAGDLFGPTVNRAARVMAVGHGGQVLLSASAGALAGERLPPGASLLDLGEHRLKDLGRPERVFQLVHPDLEAIFSPLTTLRADGAGQPVRTVNLVGRQAEIKEIRNRLGDAQVRLLTLTGPGGTGKTSLAMRVAEDLSSDFPDGVCFIDLSNARNTNAVLVAIARSIGLGEVIDRPLQEELTDRLRSRRMLLILDNFEQVTEAAGALAQLLSDCPDLTVMATSREALHLRAEHVFPVPPLLLPPAAAGHATAGQAGAYEAVELFVDRAQAVRPDFRLTDENAPAIVEICRRLDGLPLAIELAAARLRLFSPEVLRDRLGDRLGLLRSGPRDLPERHQALRATMDWSYGLLDPGEQALRATMDWSYGLLDPGEQRLFEFLAVFADAEINAVEAVAAEVDTFGGLEGGAVDILDGLFSLADKSLIRQVDVPGQEPRVAMLETIREFAADRLDQRPAFEVRARRAHATYFADAARRWRSELTGNQREAALTALASDIANLRIAWAYWVAARDIEQLDKLADSLLILNDSRGWYLDTVGLTTDMLEVLAASPSAPDRVGQEIALRTSLARALMATKGFTQEVEDAFTGAVELFESGVDGRQQFSVLRGLATLYEFRAQFDKAADLGRQILALGERENDPRILLDGHLVLGSTKAFIDDLQGGLDHLDQAIALAASVPARARAMQVGNDPRVASLTTSAFTLWLLGYPDRASERMDAAIALSAELDHPFTAVYARFHAGLLNLWRREPGLAFERATGLLEIAEEHDFRTWSAAGGCLLGAAQVGLGRFEDGLANIRAGMDLYRGLRSPLVFWPMLLYIDAGASYGVGTPANGLPAIDSAIELMSPGAGTTLVPELHLLKGDLLAAIAAADGRDDPVAEGWYRSAFDRADELGARMTLLRAATRLARLAQARGEAEAAAGLLSPIYASFTEGSATADLREAKDVLET
jgi:predicted ATPase/class 3 adenylate cyclase